MMDWSEAVLLARKKLSTIEALCVLGKYSEAAEEAETLRFMATDVLLAAKREAINAS